MSAKILELSLIWGNDDSTEAITNPVALKQLRSVSSNTGWISPRTKSSKHCVLFEKFGPILIWTHSNKTIFTHEMWNLFLWCLTSCLHFIVDSTGIDSTSHVSHHNSHINVLVNIFWSSVWLYVWTQPHTHAGISLSAWCFISHPVACWQYRLNKGFD